MIYDNDTAHPVNNTYKISPLEINSEQCIIFETYTDENLLIEETVCKKLNKTINYSNIFSLLDINFNGYICLSYNPCPTNFQVHLPLLNVGNIMYIKYHDNGGNINYYYDSNDRLLNYSSQVETVNCMYKKINSKKYICYYLSKNNENYTLQTAIDFLEDNKIIKREILNSKQLSFEDYNKQLPKFSEYLEKIKFIINLFHIVLHGFLSSSSNFPLLGEVCYFSFKSRFLCWIHQTGQEIQRISWSVCNCSTLLKELKINHYKIRPRTPEHNG